MSLGLFWQRFLLPLAVFLAFLLGGFFLQKFASAYLHRLARKTQARWDDAVVRSFGGMIIFWFLLAGLSVALRLVLLPTATRALLFKFITLAAIISAVLFFVRLAGGLVSFYLDRLAGVPTSLFRTITKIIIYTIGFLIVLDYLGISITPLITTLGIGGLAIALALQDTLANLFAGLHILVTRKIRPGDYIRLDSGEEGFVTDITWRNTTIRSLPNNLIIIPNTKLASSIVTNYSLPEKEMALLIQFSVSYGTDLERAEKVIQDVAREVLAVMEGGVASFQPIVRFHTLGDSGIEGTIILRVREFTDQYEVRHEFLKKLHERFRREKIEIPFPVRTVFLHQKDS